MQKEIEKINGYLESRESVVVEAAHIYADKQPAEEQLTSALLASGVSAGLKARIVRTLLIDDYNVVEKTLNTKSYLDWLSDHGYVPDHVFMESDLVSDARELVKELKDRIPPKKFWIPKNDFRKQNHELAFWTRERKVFVVTRENRPSCPLLDAALYLRKSRLAAASLTVLPERYAPEQRATGAILEKLDRSLPIVNLYFSSKGRRIVA